MTGIKDLTRLSTLIAELDEDNALALTRQMISDGVDPLRIIEFSHKGIIDVGVRYENGIYFISGLVMAGEIIFFNSGMRFSKTCIYSRMSKLESNM